MLSNKSSGEGEGSEGLSELCHLSSQVTIIPDEALLSQN